MSTSIASPRPPQLPMKGNRFGKVPTGGGRVPTGGGRVPTGGGRVPTGGGRVPTGGAAPPHAPGASTALSPAAPTANGHDDLGGGGQYDAHQQQHMEYHDPNMYADPNGGMMQNGIHDYPSDGDLSSTPTVPPRPKKGGMAPPLKPSKTTTLHRSPPSSRSRPHRTSTAPHQHQPTPPNSNSPLTSQQHAFPLNEQERQILQFTQQLKAGNTLQRQQPPHSQPHHQRQQAAHIQNNNSQSNNSSFRQQPQQAPHSVHGGAMGTPQRSTTGGGMTPAPPQGSAPGNAAAGAPPKKKMTKADIREKVAREIVSTEETYVKSLKVLSDLYINPLHDLVTAGKTVISKKQIDVIFSNIALILPLNAKFCEDLTARVNDWDQEHSTVSDIFKSFAPYFKMYTSYVNNHDNAVEAYKQQIENNDKFAKFCEAAEANPLSEAQKLTSLLITPIQRIPRYRLLLQEMEKNTAPEFSHLAAEKDALELVKAVAEQINESVRQQGNRAQIISIQERFQGDVTFVEPSRRFIHEGVLTKVCRSADKKYVFFLFSDLLVYASRGGFKLKLHRRIPIGNLFGFSDLDDTPTVKHRFQIASQNKSFVVYADNEKDKAKWLFDLTNVSVEVQKTLSHQDTGNRSQQLAPVWQPDVSSSQCTVCKANFSMFKRRHHCRRCGKLVCNECSKTRAILTANDKNKIQRVCDDCIVLLKRRDDRPPTGQENDSSGESDSDDDNEVLCKAMYEYVADDDRELTIRKGDIIRVIHRDPSGWWTGELGDRMGIFPSTYTQIMEQDVYDPNTEANGHAAAQSPHVAAHAAQNGGAHAAASPGASSADVVVVTTAYTAAGQGELTLQVGDRIAVKNRDPSGWWCGRLESTEEVGWFSPEFVESFDDSMSDVSSVSSMQRTQTYGAGMCPDCTCSGFRPNTFRPNLCRECWHAESVHSG